jgi:Holliday junction DNA helicase RuvB
MEERDLLVSGLPEDEVFQRAAYYVRGEGICRRASGYYLLEIKRRRLYRNLGYSSVIKYAQRRLGLSRREARERIRVAAALEELPRIDQAFARGEIAWSKVRSLTRVATTGTEEEWLAMAKEKTSDQVEAAVSGARRGARPRRKGLNARPPTFPIPYRLTADQHRKVDAAVKHIRTLKGEECSPAEAFAYMAEISLGLGCGETPEGLAAREVPPDLTVYYRCEACGSASILDEDGEEVPVPREAAERAEARGPVYRPDPPEDPGDDAVVLFGERGTIPPEERDAPISPAMRRVLLARDGYRCVCCGRREDLEAHHLRALSKGGKTELSNLVAVCHACHCSVHAGLVEIRVKSGRLMILDREGQPINRNRAPSDALDPGDESFPLRVIERGTENNELRPQSDSIESFSVSGEAFSLADIPSTITAEEWRQIRGALDWNAARRSFVLRPDAMEASDPEPPRDESPGAGPAPANPDRPAHLDDYVGQDAVVRNLSLKAQAARRDDEALGHILLTGPPGLGKTSLARLVAGLLGVGFHDANSSAIETPLQLLGLLADLARGDVLFIDEIHGLDRACQTLLLSALEDRRVDLVIQEGARVRKITMMLEPFTLVGATTEPGSLGKPFRDRFETAQNLTYYRIEELKRVIQSAAERRGLPISDAAALELARRSRETPRCALNLLKTARAAARVDGASRIELEHARRAAEIEGVDEDGLRAPEHEILRYLVSRGHPVGVKTIADALGLDWRTVRAVYEPFLVRHGFLARTERGRVATEKARARVRRDYHLTGNA